MNNGALCVKKLLDRHSFTASDDKAESLWQEIKAYWIARDRERTVDKSSLPDELSPEDVSCESDIQEIEGCHTGDLDTFVRDYLLDGISKVTGGVSWPVNGDPESLKKAAVKAIVSGLSDRGIERTKTLE